MSASAQVALQKQNFSVVRTGLSYAYAVAVDNAGNYYIPNKTDNTLIKRTPGGVETVIASPVFLTYYLAVDASQNVYYAYDDGQNQGLKMVKLTMLSNGTYTSSVLFTLDSFGTFAVNQAGTVIYLTHSDHIIRMTLTSGTWVETDISTPPPMYPGALALDPSGTNLYFTAGDTTLREIPNVATSSTVTIVNLIPQGADSVLVDAAGAIYIGFSVPGYVRKETPNGAVYNESTVVRFLQNNRQLAMTPGGDLVIGESGPGRIDQVSAGSLLDLGRTYIGSSNTTTLTFNIPAGTKLGTIQYLDGGVANAEYSAKANDTSTTLCKAQTYATATTCTVDVTFTPTQPGMRRGAVRLFDGSTPTESLLTTVSLSGVGYAPKAAFTPGVKSTLFGTAPKAIAVDGAGNVFYLLGTAVYKNGSPVIQNTTYSDLTSLAIDGAGNLFGTSAANKAVIMFPLKLDGTYDTPTFPATFISAPSSISFDVQGNGYVCVPANGFIAQMVPNTYGGYTVNNAFITGATTPTLTAVDSNRNVYIMGGGGLTWYNFTPSSVFENDFINSIQGTSLAIDAADVLYISSTSGITRYGPDGSGNLGFNPYAPGLFNKPTIIAFDPLGNLIVGDTSTTTPGVYKLDVSSPTTFTFATGSPVGQLSPDSPKQTTVLNLGSAPLTLTQPATNAPNPSITGPTASSFTLGGNGYTCDGDLLYNNPFVMNPGYSCVLGANYTPVAGGNNAVLTLYSDTLNQTNGSSVINLTNGIASAAFSSLSITGLASSATAGTGTAFTVTAKKADNSTYTGYTGTITLSSAQDANVALVGGGKTYTFVAGDNGTHTFASTAGVVFQKAGNDTLTVTDTTASVAATSGTIAVSAGTASSLTANAGATQSAAITSAFSTPLQVLVTDAYGNGIRNATVTFTVPSTGASATLSASTCVTGSAGTCSVTATANGVVSSSAYTVSAAAAGLTSATFSLTNTKVIPTLAVSFSPTSVVYGQNVVVSATMTPTTVSGTAATGLLAFYEDGSSYYSASVAAGAVTSSAQASTPGTHTFGTAYQGDATFSAVGVTNATGFLTVSKAVPVQTGPAVQPVPVTVNSTGATIPVTLSNFYGTAFGVSVPGAGGSATETYAYYLGATPVASGSGTTAIPVSTNGTVAIPVPSAVATVPGTYTLFVSFNGDSNYQATQTALQIAVQVGLLTPTVTYPAQAAITYGTALTANLNATTAYGATSLTSGGTTAYTATLLPSGTPVAVTAATTLTPGTYTLTATWTPNTTNALTYKSASATTTLVVNTAAATISTTTITQSYGNTSTGMATVAGLNGLATPTGTLSYSIDGGTATTATLSGGQAAVSIAKLTGGAHTLSLSYLGDGNYAASTTATVVNFTVTKATTTVAGSAVTQTYGTATSSTVSVTGFPGAATPTGTLTYSIDGGTAQTPTLVSGAYTVSLAATLAAGPHTIALTYNGDGNYATSTGSVSFTTSKATLTVTAANATKVYGAALPTLSATATGQLNGDTFTATASTTATTTSPVATYSIVPAVTGTNLANYTVNPVNGTLTVTKATTAVAGSAVTQSYGTATSSAVAVTGVLGGATPTGTVTYSIDGGTGVAGTLVSGAFTVPVAATLAAGNHSIALTYNGDVNYSTSTGVVSFTTSVATLTVTGVNATKVYGAAIPTLSATVTGQLNGDTFTATATTTATALSPVASYSIVPAVTGANVANYTTNLVNGTLTVTKATPAAALAASANSVLLQNPETLTATISSNASVPTGSVNFLDGTTLLSTAAMVNGVAVLNTSTLALGTHTITAVYSGDTNFVSVTSAAQSVVVLDFNLAISTTAGSATSATITPGGTATYPLTISPTGAATFPAAVTLTVSGLPVGATYTLTPSTIASGAGATPVTLTITAPIAHAKAEQSPLGRGLMPVALGLLLLPFSRKLRKRMGKLAAVSLMLLAGITAAAGLTGCGFSTGFFAQPQQTYTVTVTGTSGTLSHSTTVTLTIQ